MQETIASWVSNKQWISKHIIKIQMSIPIEGASTNDGMVKQSISDFSSIQDYRQQLHF